MSATITLPTILRPYAGGARVVEASGSTVAEVFADVADRFPELGAQLLAGGQLASFVNVFVDDEDIRYAGGLEAGIREGAEITVLPAVAGGAP